MTAAKTHVQLGTKALNVMALRDLTGWVYFAEVVDRQNGAEVRTRAVNPQPFATAAAALSTGLAYARWIASDQPYGYDPDAEVATEFRPA